jgi:hypothetical protein
MKNYKEFVCKFKKAIYGLWQTSRDWNKRINRFMKQKGFKQCRLDINIYVQTKQGQVVYLVLYVNNLSIFSKSLDEIKKVKLALLKEFEMKDLGETEFRLRI